MDFKDWLRGLIGALVAGSATSGGSWMALATAKGAGLEVPVLNWKALGVILLVGAGTNLFSYLKQSPLPASMVKSTVTVTKETKLE